MVHKNTWAMFTGLFLLLLSPGLVPSPEADIPSKSAARGITQAAAKSCDLKVKRLEKLAEAPDPEKRQTTKFSENEINSYLALELSSKYHPSLKSLLLTLREAELEGVATVDFDYVGMSSTKFVTKLLAKMFSGVHDLTVQGKLLAAQGKASFQLREARFDNTVLPNFLVEEIISAVGRKQKPPIDPIKPSQLPFGIESVDLHAGYVLVHQ